LALALASPALACGAMVAPAAAQTSAPGDDQSEDIVVTARRSGAPMWEVVSGRGTVLLVGEINEVPKATPWRPERLEAATARADQVILGTRAKISAGDIFRLLLRGNRLKKLPPGRTTTDYLSRRQQQRLAAIERRTGRELTRQSMLMSAFQLLSDELKFNRNTTDNATDVVRRAARRASVRTQPVGTVRGEDLLDSLFGAAPETHVACLDAAMAAYDDGPDGVLQRGRDWTVFDVVGVMRSPLEVALGRCWPWTDGAFAEELREQWNSAIHEALARPDVTLAVVPLRMLAERDGLLDQLQARSVQINGPAWRDAKFRD
jgi:hypothetical protein